MEFLLCAELSIMVNSDELDKLPTPTRHHNLTS
jgi:hypothetical protein